MTPMSLVVPIIAALLALATVSLLFSAFRRQKTVLMSSGARRVAPSDIEKLLGPIARMLMGARGGGGRQRVAMQLQWANSRWSPEAYVLMPWILGPSLAVSAMVAFASIGLDFTLIGAGGFLGGLVGFLYPGVKIGGRLKVRRAKIAADVPVFMAQYARTAAIDSNMNRILAEMYNRVIQERARTAARAGLEESIRLRRYGSAYASDLWTGLTVMMERQEGLVRPTATFDDPDLLLEFIIWCDDADLAKFMVNQRLGRLENRKVEGTLVDKEVASIRKERIEQIKRSIPKQQTKAIMFLVGFCLPMLMAVLLIPMFLGDPAMLSFLTSAGQ